MLPQIQSLVAAYCAAGAPVLPLHKKSKVPSVGHGVKDASTDTDAYKERFIAGCNVGIATGYAFDVIDLDGLDAVRGFAADLAKDRGLDDAETYTSAPIERCCELFESEIGPVSITRKGAHILCLPDAQRSNQTKLLCYGESAVDYRTIGGYIVAPPSIHPEPVEKDGVKKPFFYHWFTAFGLPHAPAPAFLPLRRGKAAAPKQATLSLEQSEREQSEQRVSDTEASECTAQILPFERVRFTSEQKRRKLDAALSELRHATKGERNNELNRCAFTVARICGDDDAFWHDARVAFFGVAREIGLEFSEVNATLHSARIGGQNKPIAAQGDLGRALKLFDKGILEGIAALRTEDLPIPAKLNAIAQIRPEVESDPVDAAEIAALDALQNELEQAATKERRRARDQRRAIPRDSAACADESTPLEQLLELADAYTDERCETHRVSAAHFEQLELDLRCPKCGSELRRERESSSMHCFNCDLTLFKELPAFSSKIPVRAAEFTKGAHDEPLIEALPGCAANDDQGEQPIVLNACPCGTGKTKLAVRFFREAQQFFVITARRVLSAETNKSFAPCKPYKPRGSSRRCNWSPKEAPRLSTTVHSLHHFKNWPCDSVFIDELTEVLQFAIQKEDAIARRAALSQSLLALREMLCSARRVMVSDACALNDGHLRALRLLAPEREIVAYTEPQEVKPKQGAKARIILSERIFDTLKALKTSKKRALIFCPEKKAAHKLYVFALALGCSAVCYTAENPLPKSPAECAELQRAQFVIYNSTIGSGVSIESEGFDTAIAVLSGWGFEPNIEGWANQTATKNGVLQALFRARCAKNLIVALPYRGFNGLSVVPSLEQLRSEFREAFADEFVFHRDAGDALECDSEQTRWALDFGAAVLYGNVLNKQCIISKVVRELRDRYGVEIIDETAQGNTCEKERKKYSKLINTVIKTLNTDRLDVIDASILEKQTPQFKKLCEALFADYAERASREKEHWMSIGCDHAPKVKKPLKIASFAAAALGYSSALAAQRRREIKERSDDRMPLIADRGYLSDAKRFAALYELLISREARDDLACAFTHPEFGDRWGGELRRTGLVSSRLERLPTFSELDATKQKQVRKLLKLDTKASIKSVARMMLTILRNGGLSIAEDAEQRRKSARFYLVDIGKTIENWAEVLPQIAQLIGNPKAAALEWRAEAVDLSGAEKALDELKAQLGNSDSAANKDSEPDWAAIELAQNYYEAQQTNCCENFTELVKIAGL